MLHVWGAWRGKIGTGIWENFYWEMEFGSLGLGFFHWEIKRLGNGIRAKFGLGNGIYTPLRGPHVWHNCPERSTWVFSWIVYLSSRPEQLGKFQPQQPFQPSQQNVWQSDSSKRKCVAAEKKRKLIPTKLSQNRKKITEQCETYSVQFGRFLTLTFFLIFFLLWPSQ